MYGYTANGLTTVALVNLFIVCADEGRSAVQPSSRRAVSQVPCRLICACAEDEDRVECIIQNSSKLPIDEVDAIWDRRYNVMEDEIDFIISHDIKHRIGDRAESEENKE